MAIIVQIPSSGEQQTELWSEESGWSEQQRQIKIQSGE
jgi:hypothetical protein